MIKRDKLDIDKVKFYLNAKPFAYFEDWNLAPNVGEDIRMERKNYRVTRVLNDYDSGILKVYVREI